MANTLMSLLVSLGVDSKDFHSAMEASSTDIDKFAKKMDETGKKVQKFGAGWSVGVTLPIVAFGKASIDAAQESAVAMAQLDAVLASTKGTIGLTKAELIAMSKAMQKTTTFSDEEVLSAETMLLQFDKLNKDQFPEALQLTADFAARMGTDLPDAALTLGKAIGDPAQGIGRLNMQLRLFSDAELKAITDMANAGDVAGAQAIIMDRLREKIGGTADAIGQSTEGQIAEWKNQLNDAQEIIGNALIPVLIRLLNAITPLIERFAAMSPAQQNMIIGFFALLAVIGPVVGVVGTLMTVFSTLLPILVTVFTFLSTVAIPTIFAFIAANILWLGPLLLIIATVYLVYLAFKNNFGGITTTVQQLGFIIQFEIQKIITWISNLIQKVAEMAAKFASVNLPEWLKPGSPTPFEMGLRGIVSAMDVLSGSSVPALARGLQFAPAGQTSPTQMQPGANTSGGIRAANITIHNPKLETSEDSIKKTLKNLSYLGVTE